MHRSTKTPASFQDRRLIEGEPEETCCEQPGCARTTTGGKPYCVDHIARMPYAAGIRLTLLRKESGRQRRAVA